jgi:hypothetical protein
MDAYKAHKIVCTRTHRDMHPWAHVCINVKTHNTLCSKQTHKNYDSNLGVDVKLLHCDWARFSFFLLTCDSDSHGGDDGGIVGSSNERVMIPASIAKTTLLEPWYY